MKKNHSNLYFIYALILLLTGVPVFAESKKCIYCAGTYIPLGLAVLTRNVISLIQVLVPVILIITGMVSLLRAVIAGDEKKMDEVKPKLIRKFIAGVIIFLIFTIVKFGFSLLGNYGGTEGVMKCVSLFISEEGNETYCPPRVTDTTGLSSEEKQDLEYNLKVKNCADRATAGECTVNALDCHWNGNYCEYTKNEDGTRKDPTYNTNAKKCGDIGKASDCNASGCSWNYSGNFCEYDSSKVISNKCDCTNNCATCGNSSAKTACEKGCK